MRLHGNTGSWHYLIIALAVVVMWAILGGPRQRKAPVVSSAPGLAGAFSKLNPEIVKAVESAPQVGLAVRGAPSITVARIEEVLAQYNSPAKGQGQVIYDLGVRYNIDPAICLAFFIHESSAGSNRQWAGWKPDGTTTHNVGNIICTPGYQCHGRFRDYANWHDGIADWYKLIDELYIGEWQRETVEEIIPKYAPAADNNDESAYINSVKSMVQSWQKGP